MNLEGYDLQKFTPMMQQYVKTKEQYKDCILFYRLGDFYEMFFDDAKIASQELDLVLTGRNAGQEDRVPMCGIPHHAANLYIDKLIEKGVIEIAPLAYMRGRTLDNAIVILDEGQNATSNQMKMFVTRLGFNSKMIITGDITQIDLPNKSSSGLIEATRLLADIDGIKHIEFGALDVMRHPIVTKIIAKYEEKENDKI